MSKNKLFISFFSKFLLKEWFYLFGTFLISISLSFIFIMIFLGRDLYIHYANMQSSLLPQTIAIVDQNLSAVNEVLKANPEYSSSLRGELLHLDDVSFYTSRSSKALLPEKYTLLAFDINNETFVQFKCNNKIIDANILDVYSTRKGRWGIKTSSFECKANEVSLLLKESEIKLKIKRNSKRYTKLEYQTDIKTDKLFYPYMIKLCENKFFDYYPISKFFTFKEELTPDTQKHAKMLKSFFQIIYSGNKDRVVANSQAYAYLNDYKKISFRIHLNNSQLKDKITVVDKFPFPIMSQDNIRINVLLGNLDAFRDVKFDKRFIFFDGTNVDKSLFRNAKWINKYDLLPELEKFKNNVDMGIVVMSLLLLVFMLAFASSFVQRLYSAYEDMMRQLLFFGMNYKLITMLFSVIFIVGVFMAYLISTYLFANVNKIFTSYYIDIVEYSFDYIWLMLFIIFTLVYSLKLESKLQNNNLKNYKG